MPPSNRWIALPLLLAAAVSIGVLVFSELSHERLFEAGAYARRSLDLQDVTREIQTLVLDAETSQRGYLLTGRGEYLEPYKLAVQKLNDRLNQLRTLIPSSSDEQLQRVDRINQLIGQRMSEIEMSLMLYRERGSDAADALMHTDIGRRTMDELRVQIQAFSAYEQANSGALWTLWEQDILSSRFGMALSSAFNIFLLTAIYLLTLRDTRLRIEASRQQLEHQQSLEQTVHERTAELSRAYRHLQTIQEAEKSKLARDLHDEIGAILVSAKMDASWVQQHLQPLEQRINDKLQRLLVTLDDGVQIKRRIIEELRPTLLDNLGLGAAIEWQTSEVCTRANLIPHISIPEEEPTWPNEVAIALFRIVQEALTNIVRYAKAQAVWVELGLSPDGVRLSVRDDGVGLASTATAGAMSHGILGMRERIMGLGGVFRMESAPHGGTLIEVFVPIVHGVATTSPPS
ncbi:MAG TPA: CHASE3 domain-containing protein, partial [Burkholderiales bacterium]